MTRGMTLIKMYFVNEINTLSMEIAKQTAQVIRRERLMSVINNYRVMLIQRIYLLKEREFGQSNSSTLCQIPYDSSKVEGSRARD